MKDTMGLQLLSWEQYRLNIVEEWPDGPYKEATLAAIHSTIERALQNSPGPAEVTERIIILNHGRSGTPQVHSETGSRQGHTKRAA